MNHNETYAYWKKLYKETGLYGRREVVRNPKEIEPERLKMVLDENPDAYLYELADRIQQTRGFCALKRPSITY